MAFTVEDMLRILERNPEWQDMNRAAARAELLRRAGVNATPAVIGEEWSLPDVQALAQQECVEWFVGDGLSQGFLEFRKLPNGLPPR
jgi:hypothetical protein